MAAVALDADVLIAFLDAADEQHQVGVDVVRARLAAGDDLFVGASVCAEILVRPLQQGTAGRVEEFLDAIDATVVAVDRGVARRAAQLRAQHRTLRLPDAMSLAAAQSAGAELLTLDRRLQRIAERAGDS